METEKAGPAQVASHVAVGHAVGCERSQPYVMQTGALQARCAGRQLVQLWPVTRLLGWITPLTTVYWEHWRPIVCVPCVREPLAWQVREHGLQMLLSSHWDEVHWGLAGHGAVTGPKTSPPQ